MNHSLLINQIAEFLHPKYYYYYYHHTGFPFSSPLSNSGAIHPSVPGIPERRLKLCRPSGSFLQRPKSEMTARTRPSAPGVESRMLRGFRSL